MLSNTPARSASSAIVGPATMLVKENNDCVVRALSVASGLSYDDCHAFLELHGRKPRRGTHTACILPGQSRDYPELGIRATRVAGFFMPKLFSGECAPADWLKRGTTLRTFCRVRPTGNYLVCVAGHGLAVRDGVIYDGSSRDLRRIKTAWKIERL